MIVVGVDGSEESKQALRWALGEAATRGTSLRVVDVWQLPLIDYWSYLPSDLLNRKVFEEHALEVIAEALDETGGSESPVEIERVTCEGEAARVLVDLSSAAELLVVGSRGHGGFTGLLLGSVSQHCVQHAACPVVVVRAGVDAKSTGRQKEAVVDVSN